MSNLPPGCRQRDVDDAAGDYWTECVECERPFIACELNEDSLCEQCVESLEEEDETEES